MYRDLRPKIIVYVNNNEIGTQQYLSNATNLSQLICNQPQIIPNEPLSNK